MQHQTLPGRENPESSFFFLSKSRRSIQVCHRIVWAWNKNIKIEIKSSWADSFTSRRNLIGNFYCYHSKLRRHMHMKTNLSGNNEMQNRWSDTFSTLDVYHGMQITNVKRWTCVWANRKLQKMKQQPKFTYPSRLIWITIVHWLTTQTVISPPSSR